MGQLRNANAQDQKSFPGSDFAASNAVPITQCEESIYDDDNSESTSIPNRVITSNKLPSANIATEILRITASVGGNTGPFLITFNNTNIANLTTDPGNGNPIAWHIEVADPPTISGNNATTTDPPPSLTDVGAFAGFTLTGRICVITSSIGGNTGEFTIQSQTDDRIILFPTPGIGANVQYFIKSAIPITQTQTIQTIMKSAQAEGAATMIKGGQLYIDGSIAQVEPACKIIFNPA